MSTPPFEGPSSGPDPGTIPEEAPPNPPNEQGEPIATTTPEQFDPPVEVVDEWDEWSVDEESDESEIDEVELLDRVVREILNRQDHVPLEAGLIGLNREQIDDVFQETDDEEEDQSRFTSDDEEHEIPRVITKEWMLNILQSDAEPTRRQRAVISQFSFATGCKNVSMEDMYPRGRPSYHDQQPSTSKDYSGDEGEKSHRESSEEEDNTVNIPIRRKLASQHVQRHSRVETINRIRQMNKSNKDIMKDSLNEIANYSIKWNNFRRIKPRSYYDESDSSSPEREREPHPKVNGYRSPQRHMKKGFLPNGAKKEEDLFSESDDETHENLPNGVKEHVEHSEEDDEEEEEENDDEQEDEQEDEEEGQQEEAADDEEVEEEAEDEEREEQTEDEEEEIEEEEEEEEEFEEDDDYMNLQKQKSDILDVEKITRREMRKRERVMNHKKDVDEVESLLLAQADLIQKRMVAKIEQMTTITECSYLTVNEEKNRFMEEIATCRSYNRIRMNLNQRIGDDEYREAVELPPGVKKPVNELIEEEKKLGLLPFPGYDDEEDDEGEISEYEIEDEEETEDDSDSDDDSEVEEEEEEEEDVSDVDEIESAESVEGLQEVENVEEMENVEEVENVENDIEEEVEEDDEDDEDDDEDDSDDEEDEDDQDDDDEEEEDEEESESEEEDDSEDDEDDEIEDFDDFIERTSEIAIGRHIRNELEHRWRRHKLAECHEAGPSREHFDDWQMRQFKEAYAQRQQYRAANPNAHQPQPHPPATAISVYGTRSNANPPPPPPPPTLPFALPLVEDDNKMYEEELDGELLAFAQQQLFEQQLQLQLQQQIIQQNAYSFDESLGALYNGSIMTRSSTPQQQHFALTPFGLPPYVSSPNQLVHSSSSSQLSALAPSNLNSNHYNHVNTYRETYSSPKHNHHNNSRSTPVIPNGVTHAVASPPIINNLNHNHHMTPTYSGNVTPTYATPVHTTRSSRKVEEMENKKENVDSSRNVKEDDESNDETTAENLESSTQSASSAARMQRKKKLAASTSSLIPEKKSKRLLNNDHENENQGRSSTKRTRMSAVNNSNNSLKSKSKDNDEPTYCVCSRISFGEMIGCDNEKCEIEWFHFECVNLSNKPKGKWYCPDCRHPDWGAKLPKTSAPAVVAAAAATNVAVTAGGNNRR